MTERTPVKNVAGMATGLSGWRQTHCRPPPSFQRRLESRKAEPGGEGVAGFIGWRVRLSLLWLSFPLCGNGLFQPLDSGLRRNDGRSWGKELDRHGKGAVGMTTNPLRPPSSFQRRLEFRKAGRGVMGWQGLSDGAFDCRPRDCHSRSAGMACFNHPACSRQVDSGFRRAATGLLPSRRIQDFLSINDDGGDYGLLAGPLRASSAACSRPAFRGGRTERPAPAGGS